jgi:ABC-2 type transport system permease protein
MNVFLAFLRKEFAHIVRDRRTLLIVLAMPLMQVLLFGYAIRNEVTDVRLAIVDPAPDAVTLDIRGRLAGTGLFRIVSVDATSARLERLFRAQKAQVAVVFQPGFAGRLARGEATQVQVITDAAEPNTGSRMQAYVTQVIQAWQMERQDAAQAFRIQPAVRMRFNPTLKSVNLFVPGLIALVLTLISALMTAVSLTREKETGTMEILLVSPLRPWQIISGKVLPYLVLGFACAVSTLVAARVVFHVPIRGSVTLFLAESLLYVLVSLGMGVLISSRTSSQRAATMGALAGLMMPTQLLSGFVFPLESMPGWLRPFTNIVPARWFVVIARGIMLKGVGITYLWRETLVLAVMAAFLLVLSIRTFRVRLE